MNHHIDIQHASTTMIPISDALLCQWAQLPLAHEHVSGELTLRLVDPDEMTHLNGTYRQKNKPTNVLAFPAALPEPVELECPLLGDVVVCPSVLAQESQLSKISLEAHWAHIVMHGVLHLLGYDHMKDEEARIMETIEVTLLAQLGFDNPYQGRLD